MARTILVKNVSEDRVLVGPQFLLAGEQREVLESHYLAAVGKDKLKVVGGGEVQAKAEAKVKDGKTEAKVEADAEADKKETPTGKRGRGRK